MDVTGVFILKVDEVNKPSLDGPHGAEQLPWTHFSADISVANGPDFTERGGDRIS